MARSRTSQIGHVPFKQTSHRTSQNIDFQPKLRIFYMYKARGLLYIGVKCMTGGMLGMIRMLVSSCLARIISCTGRRGAPAEALVAVPSNPPPALRTSSCMKLSMPGRMRASSGSLQSSLQSSHVFLFPIYNVPRASYIYIYVMHISC